MALTLLQAMALFGNDPMKQRLIMSFLGGSESVILPQLYFVDANDLLGYTFTTVDDLGDVTERSLNGAYADTDTKGSAKRENLGIFGGSVRTDQIWIDEKGDAARLMRIEKKMIANGKYFDDVFFNGNSQTNPKQFNGLAARAIAKARVLYTGANGGALTLDLLDEALDAVGGDNSRKVIHCDRWTRRKISNLVKAAAGGKNLQEAQVQVAEYNGAKILTLVENHKKLGIFPATEVRGTSGAVCRSLYVVRYGAATDEEYIQGIRGKTFMKLRQPSNQGEYVRDVIDNVLGIGDFGDFSFMRIAGIL